MILILAIGFVFGVILISVLLDVPALFQIHRSSAPKAETLYTELRLGHIAQFVVVIMMLTVPRNAELIAHTSLFVLYAFLAAKSDLLQSSLFGISIKDTTERK